MSDDKGIAAGIGQFAQDVGEALVEPVKDQVGEAIEQGVQAVAPPKQQPSPQTPQQLREQQAEQVKKREEEKKRLDWAQATIARYQKIEEEQAAVRAKKKQEEQVKQQEEEVEKQELGFELQQKEQKSQDIALQQAKTKTEVRGGVGG